MAKAPPEPIIDPDLPINRMASIETLVASSVTEPRFRTLLFSAFALVALALVITGLFGVLTYAVARRTKEIGVRVALGAGPGAVARLIVRQGLAVTTAGLVAGLDLRHPAVKLPGFGRVGIDDGTAVAAPAPAK